MEILFNKTKHYDSKIFTTEKIPIHFLYSGGSMVHFTIYKIMKKIVIILAAVTLSSCSFEKYVDCDCSTVYEVIENPSDDGSISGTYRTYNACEDKFKKYNWIETAPKIGECK